MYIKYNLETKSSTFMEIWFLLFLFFYAEDLFYNVKVSHIKSNKVRGHFLSKHALLKISFLIVLVIRALLLRIFII